MNKGVRIAAKWPEVSADLLEWVMPSPASANGITLSRDN
jgi:hypothetical protein